MNRLEVRARLRQLHAQLAALPAEAEDKIGIDPAFLNEMVTLALSGEIGEALATIAIGRIEAAAGAARNGTEQEMRRALAAIHETARNAYDPEKARAYAVVPVLEGRA